MSGCLTFFTESNETFIPIHQKWKFSLFFGIVFVFVFRYDSSTSTVDRETIHCNDSLSPSRLTALEAARAASHSETCLGPGLEGDIPAA